MSRKPKIPKEKTQEQKDKSINRLAKFIVTKFIQKANIIWSRDIKIATVLAKQYNDKAFWEFLPCYFPMVAMTMMITPKAKLYVEREYAKFKLVLPTKVEYKLENEKIGEDICLPKPVAKSVFEFCR